MQRASQDPGEELVHQEAGGLHREELDLELPILFVTPAVTFTLNRQWVFR